METRLIVLNARDAGRTFGETMNRVAFGRAAVLLVRRNVPLAVLLPVGLDPEQLLQIADRTQELVDRSAQRRRK